MVGGLIMLSVSILRHNDESSKYEYMQGLPIFIHTHKMLIEINRNNPQLERIPTSCYLIQDFKISKNQIIDLYNEHTAFPEDKTEVLKCFNNDDKYILRFTDED